MADVTFSGPIRQGPKDRGPGVVPAARVLPIQAVAQANTDFTVFQPAGMRMRISHQTTTAYTGTTATLQVGTTVGGQEVAVATDIKAGNLVNIPITQAGFAQNADQTLHVRLVQTGATAVGAGRLVIEYLPV